MRKERITDNVLSLNLYSTEYDYGNYINDIRILEFMNKTEYYKDQPLYMSNSMYFRNSYKKHILTNNVIIHELYNKIVEFLPLHDKNVI